jgi:hypothetical protein
MSAARLPYQIECHTRVTDILMTVVDDLSAFFNARGHINPMHKLLLSHDGYESVHGHARYVHKHGNELHGLLAAIQSDRCALLFKAKGGSNLSE